MHAITAGCRPRSPASRPLRRGTCTEATTRPPGYRGGPTRARVPLAAAVGQLQARQPRQLAGHPRALDRRRHLLANRDELRDAGNFMNVITPDGGVTMIAFGVVFVLLIGEIDLSIAYVSGIAAVASPSSRSRSRARLSRLVCHLHRGRDRGDRRSARSGVVRGPDRRTVVRRHAGRLPRLAGRDPSLTVPGEVVIQDDMINNCVQLLLQRAAGWIMAAIVSIVYVGECSRSDLAAAASGPRARSWHCSSGTCQAPGGAGDRFRHARRHDPEHDRGVPFALLLVVGALSFGRSSPSGRRSAAMCMRSAGTRRRASRAINVARIRILVFMISGAMAGLGGIVLAARLNSVDTNPGGGTLLIDAIAAAVIGGIEPLRRPRRDPKRPHRGNLDLGHLERDVHPRLLDRDDLRRDRPDPALRRHVRHDRAAPADQGRSLEPLARSTTTIRSTPTFAPD